MAAKPGTVPQLDTNQTNRTAPIASKISDGYVLNDLLPSSNFNYLVGFAGDWLSWVDERIFDGATEEEMFLRGRSMGSEDGLLLDATTFAAQRAGLVDWGFHREGAAVVNNSVIADVFFRADEGSGTLKDFARIRCEVDGTPASGTSHPGSITFATVPDGGTSMVERMRVVSSGSVGINNEQPNRLLNATATNLDALALKLLAPTTDKAAFILESDTESSVYLTTTGGTRGALRFKSSHLYVGNVDSDGENASPNETNAIVVDMDSGPTVGINLITDVTAFSGGKLNVYQNGTVLSKAQNALSGSAIVVEASTSTSSGIQFFCDDGDESFLAFGDATSNNVARMRFQHSGDLFVWDFANTDRMTLSNTQLQVGVSPVVLEVDISADRVGVGDSPDLGSALHIKTGDAGAVTVDGTADELVIEGSGASGLTIVSSSTDTGRIFFADTGSSNAARIEHNHSSDIMTIRSAGEVQLDVFAEGNYTLTSSGLHELYRTESNTALSIANFKSDVTATETIHCAIRTDGDLENTNNSYAGFSDIRDKENVMIIGDPMAKTSNIMKALQTIDGIEYSLKQSSQKEANLFGFSAQDIQKFFPDLVMPSAIKSGRLALNSVGLIPVLWQICKELDRRLTAGNL